MTTTPQHQPSVYQFRVKDIDGREVSFSDFKGKVLLIVNTASECGFTPQLEALEQLYQEYKDQGFEVLAFPSNDFFGQEPREGQDIKEFCRDNFHTTFPIFEKTQVRGREASDLFQFLANRSHNGLISSRPKWNFHKYLVDRSGRVVNYFYSFTNPTSDKLKNAIEELLNR
jgi:glutathione peroxidase